MFLLNPGFNCTICSGCCNCWFICCFHWLTWLCSWCLVVSDLGTLLSNLINHSFPVFAFLCLSLLMLLAQNPLSPLYYGRPLLVFHILVQKWLVWNRPSLILQLVSTPTLCHLRSHSFWSLWWFHSKRTSNVLPLCWPVRAWMQLFFSQLLF